MAALSNQILIGDKLTPSYTFDNASIAKVNGVFSVDVIGNEMAVDTVTAVVRQDVVEMTSSPATLNVVNTLPSFGITVQPADRAAPVGATVTFSVTAVGSDITYQWQYNSGDGWHNSPAAGNTTDTLTLEATLARNGYRYRCRLTSGGTTISSSAVTLTIATQTAYVTDAPHTQAALKNSMVSFTVGIHGNGLTYQWQYSSNGTTWYNSPAEGNTTDTLTLEATSARNGLRYRCLVTAGANVRTIPYGTPAWWYNDGALVCAAFVRNVVREGRYIYRLTLVSGVGLLDNIMHPGGVYTGDTFADVVDEIIGGAFTYSVVGAVENLPIYGWLPYDTARNNLHQLLFATGVTLRKDENGDPIFAYLSANNPTPVPDSRIAFGGSVDYLTPASGVEITEHTYGVVAGTPSTLFDNTGSGVAVSSALVVFNGPFNSLTTTGTLTIDDSGVNYAVLSGVGTLTGIAYSHYTRVIERTDPLAATVNIKRVTDMYLVSVANSINVAKRVLAYFSSAKTIKNQIVIEGEKCGDILSLHDPYLDSVNAFLAEADVNASSNLLASCRLVEGYTPTGQGNNVSNIEILTGSGTWTVPDDVTDITVLLAGGGDGGEAGQAGGLPGVLTSGTLTQSLGGGKYRHYAYVNAESITASTGGAAGAPGAGGKTLIFTLSVTPGDVIAYSCGAGGKGAVFNGAAAEQGGDTTFGAYSSATGTASDDGIISPMSGTVMATKGLAGLAGGNGGAIQQTDEDTWEIVPAGNVGEYIGGIQGNYAYENWTTGYFSFGGFGGGAAYGANGQSGTNGSGVSYSTSANAHAPTGGNGATALAPLPAQGYGTGGTGGNGGGGAGQNGAAGINNNGNIGNTQAYVENNSSAFPTGYCFVFVEQVATPGDGSDGGDGADGCIEIYY